MTLTGASITRRTRQRVGAAMVLVLSALALAATLGTAMIEAATLQAHSVGSAEYAPRAHSLAESGVNIASYYLLYPRKAPTRNAQGYWPGAVGMTLGDSVAGTIDVQVTLAGANLYDVTATGVVTTSAGTTVSRRCRARLHIDPGWQISHGVAMVGGSVPASARYECSLQHGGFLLNWGQIQGAVYSPVAPWNLFGGTTGGWVRQLAGQGMKIPSASDLRDYHVYSYKGRTCRAGTILSSSLPSGSSLSPTADNPAGIYYHSGDLEVGAGVSINGLLINQSGNITISGGVAMTAVEGYAALLCDRDLVLKGGNAQLNINGVAWINGVIRSAQGAADAQAVRVTGALVFPTLAGVASDFDGIVRVRFDPDRAQAPDLDKTIPTPAVKPLSWVQ